MFKIKVTNKDTGREAFVTTWKKTDSKIVKGAFVDLTYKSRKAAENWINRKVESDAKIGLNALKHHSYEVVEI